jgi:hypothetical protein
VRESVLLLVVLFLVLLVACASEPAASSSPIPEDIAPTLLTNTETETTSKVITTTVTTTATQTVIPRPPPPGLRPTPILTPTPPQTSTPTPTPPQTMTSAPPTPPLLTITTTTDNTSVSTWTEWGTASFGKEYPATPGTKLNFVKVGTGTSPDGKPTTIYLPIAVGLPNDKSYYLWYKALRQNSPAQLSPLEMSIGEKGYVIPSGKINPMSISCYSFSKGEARVFALMTADKSIIAYGKVILYPIQAQQSKSRIWVELLSTTGTLFAVYGDGFQPNEELQVTSNSTGEIAKFKIIVDVDGKFTNMLLPAVVGKQSGSVTYTVVGIAGTLIVSFDWGPPALLPGP